MKFPKPSYLVPILREISKDAADLPDIDIETATQEDIEKGWSESFIDVRLQVYPNGEWAIHQGDSSYDQDHRGYWGGASVHGDMSQNELCRVAVMLVDEAMEHAADNGEDMLEAGI